MKLLPMKAESMELGMLYLWLRPWTDEVQVTPVTLSTCCQGFEEVNDRSMFWEFKNDLVGGLFGPVVIDDIDINDDWSLDNDSV